MQNKLYFGTAESVTYQGLSNVRSGLSLEHAVSQAKYNTLTRYTLNAKVKSDEMDFCQ